MKSNNDDADACKSRIRAYRTVCPAEWVENWNEQIEEGTFPGVTFKDGEE
jgi:hypothetical protein